jgi:hypothetical protein
LALLAGFVPLLWGTNLISEKQWHVIGVCSTPVGNKPLITTRRCKKMGIGIQERLETYLRSLKVIEARTRDPQLAAVAFCELAADIRTGLVDDLPKRSAKAKVAEEEPVVVRLPPRIPR